MYKDQTYEAILNRTLGRVATDVDKREGSLLMNAIAPVSAEHANIYILLGSIIQNGYADTAIREYLVLRCKERGLTPHEATKAVLKGKFNMEIPIGSRYSLNELNYSAVALIESVEGSYYYQMECENAGTEGNKYFGELSSIEYIDKDLEGALVELLIPADDEEDTEALRTRYLASFSSSAFGGNKQDYREKVNSLNGVGGTVVIPVWNGGGTVKLLIINSEYNVASETLIATVQDAIDPAPQGTGTGVAPIGHTVTVVSAEEKPVDVYCRLTLSAGYTWNEIDKKAHEAIEEYFLDLRKSWEEAWKDGEANGSLVVRVSQIENRLLNLDGVLDIADTTINGMEDNLSLSIHELPVLGGITNG